LIRLIGLTGHAGVGKDAVANFMGGKRFSFAEPLKRFVQEVFAFSDDQVWGASQHRNAPDKRYTRADGQPLTPRYALQTLGTEWGRDCYPDVWAELGVRRAREWLERGPTDAHIARPCPRPPDQAVCTCPAGAVLTDCRFINEARAIRQAGGEVWRVVRPGHVLPPDVASHPSETEQDTPAMVELVDRIIMNDGSLDELQVAVEAEVADFLARCDS
jgi:hypothetical protein